MSRVLLDFIRDESTNHRNQHGAGAKNTSKAFGRSSGAVPASDVPMRSATTKAQISRYQSSRFQNVSADSPDSPETPDDESAPADISPRGDDSPARGQMTRMLSSRAPRVTFNLDEPMPEDSPPRPSLRPSSGFSLQREKLLPEDDDDDDEAEDGEKDKDEEEGSGGDEEEAPVRMSLMDLLGRDGPAYGEGGYDDDEEEEEEEEEEEGGREEEEEEGGSVGEEHTCCVCMVRYKGAAIVPCGHTFCRLCSRELWVGKGNCPSCNGFVMEILEIF